MEIQPVGFRAIKRITHEGTMESQGMGGMVAQLVGATGEGVKGNPGLPCMM